MVDDKFCKDGPVESDRLSIDTMVSDCRKALDEYPEQDPLVAKALCLMESRSPSVSKRQTGEWYAVGVDLWRVKDTQTDDYRYFSQRTVYARVGCVVEQF